MQGSQIQVRLHLRNAQETVLEFPVYSWEANAHDCTLKSPRTPLMRCKWRPTTSESLGLTQTPTNAGIIPRRLFSPRVPASALAPAWEGRLFQWVTARPLPRRTRQAGTGPAIHKCLNKQNSLAITHTLCRSAHNLPGLQATAMRDH